MDNPSESPVPLEGHLRDVGDPPARRAALVDSLGQILAETLRSVVPAAEPCALLGFPDHPNVGDSAIWLGERALLARLEVPVTYTCNTRSYSEGSLRSRVRHGTILIHGGGNLGDLWPDHQELREEVIRAFPRNKIIQLPQSICFSNHRNLARARTVFDSHPDLTILVRERRSFEIARNEFRATSLVCPDAAFALGTLQRPVTADRDLVCLLRGDIESVGHASARFPRNGILVDWLKDDDSVRLRVNRWLYRRKPRRPRWYSQVFELVHRRVWEGLARERVRRGCVMLSRGKVVITDRLHGHILSVLLDIDHVLLDNSYGKLSSFFESWTRASDLAHWADSPEEAVGLARDLLSRSPHA